ncbi:MAG: InlB B-repeat-containing protein, partial [Coriobacteriia bacterium]|nr:InlB B-repeat-containing protein [Coriobacteriia bacterium]
MAESRYAIISRVKKLTPLLSKITSIALASVMILGVIPAFPALGNSEAIEGEAGLLTDQEIPEKDTAGKEAEPYPGEGNSEGDLSDTDGSDDASSALSDLGADPIIKPLAGELIVFREPEGDDSDDDGLKVTYDGGISYCVIFDGSTYEAGDTITVLFEPEPLRYAYKFIGWAFDAEAVEPDFFVGAEDGEAGVTTFVIEENTTLYAIWEEAEPAGIVPLAEDGFWDVTFVSWGTTVVKEEVVPDGGSATAPDPLGLHREGYNFVGWDTDFSIVTEDTIVTAKYTPITYTITYVLGGGTNDSRNPTTYTIEDIPMWFYSPTRANYEFIGWTGDYRYSIPGGTTGNITLTADWVFNECGQVSIKDASDNEIIIGRTTNGNGEGQYFIIVKDKTGKIINSEIGLDGPSGTEEFPFTFNGAGYTINVRLNIKGNDVIGIIGDVDIETFFVAFMRGTQGQFVEDEYYTEGLKSGENTPPAPPISELEPREPGWVFAGWSDGENTYLTNNDIPKVVTKGVTYTALWLPKTNTSYAVEHYLVSASGIPDSDAFLTEGLTGTTGITVYADPVDPPPAGYVVDYSYPDSIPSGVIAGDGSLVLKLYYKERSDYTVIYDLGGGEYDGESAIDNLTGIAWTESDLLPSRSFYNQSLMARPGHRFDGWFTADGDEVTNATTYAELAGGDDSVMEVTIYACWYYAEGTWMPLANKTAEGKEMTPGQFRFTVSEGSDVVSEGVSGSTSAIEFQPITFTFDDLGDHEYVIEEIDDGAFGWTYSNLVYSVKVTVEEDLDNEGVLKVTAVYYLDGEPVDDAQFKNTYVPIPTSATITGTKEVIILGGTYTMEDNDFRFVLEVEGGKPKDAYSKIQSIISRVDDNVVYGTFRFTYEFTSPGEYHFTLSEVPEFRGVANAPGWTFDDCKYEFTIIVSDNEGRLQWRLADGSSISNIVFTNKYEPLVTTETIQPSGTKTVTNTTDSTYSLAAGDFSFSL